MAVLELVTFKLLEGTSEQAFLTENENLNHWVKSQPGFEYRALAKTDDGSWTDTVFWQDMASAKAAQENFTKQKSLEGMLKLLDMASVKVEHQNIMTMQAPA